MRERPCLLFACIFLTGIAFQRYEWKALLLVLPGFLLLEIYHIFIKANVFGETKPLYKKVKRMAGRSVVLLSAFFLGMGHMKSQEAFRDAYMSKLQDGSNAVIWGEIVKLEKTEYGSRLLLTDCYVSLSEAAIPCNKVMVYASSDHFRVGQIYQMKGQLNFFERARNEGNFDAAVFYQSQKIDFFLYEEESVLLSSNENVIRDWILELKTRMEQVYINCMEEDAAGFYMGMMLGDKSLLSERTKDLFAVGGISHILAISGLHMSMIGRGFYKQLRKRRVGFLAAGVLAGLILVGYCSMVGSGTSALRAVGMMLLYFIGQYLGRSYDMLNSLGAVVIVLLWDNPFLLEYSGFQFSIAALVGVGFVGARLSEQVDAEKVYTKKVDAEQVDTAKVDTEMEVIGSQRNADDGRCRKPKMETKAIGWFGVRLKKCRSQLSASLWMSMGITLSTLPIVACCYYEAPMYSPLVNSIVLPILTPVFMLALIGALIGCVIPFVGELVLIPCGWLFSFYEFVCEFVEGLPFGSVITGMPEMEVVVGYYAVLFLGCLMIGGRRKKALARDKEQQNSCEQTETRQNNGAGNAILKCFSFEKIALCILCFVLILWTKSAKAEVIFLDVGQGDGIYIGSEDGTTCFIDGGSSDVNQVGTYRILPFLKAHGVSRIDYWFVSHADTDHISGLLEVLEDGYEIGCVVISDKMPEDENKEQLLAIASEQEVSVLHMKAGDQIQTSVTESDGVFSSGGIRITCIYPWENATDRNEQSLVLLLDFLDKKEDSIFKALFSGDISSEAEAKLIAISHSRNDLENVISWKDVDLYKAAHHGSKYSNSGELLELIQPEYCVISCGMDNSYGHPHAETLERLTKANCEILSTAEGGQITIRMDENNMVLDVFHKN